MRLNSARHIVVLAAFLVAGLVLWRWERNCFACERAGAGTPQAAQNQTPALQTNIEGFPPAPAPPAKLSFTHLSVADGLSNADVRAIAQDRQGFMWFGTWLGGLNRYDGYTFKVYKHDAQDDRSLGCDSIWALYRRARLVPRLHHILPSTEILFAANSYPL